MSAYGNYFDRSIFSLLHLIKARVRLHVNADTTEYTGYDQGDCPP